MESEVMQQVAKIHARLDSHETRISTLEHGLRQLAEAINRRLSALEIDVVMIRKSQDKTEDQLAKIMPAVQDLLQLMQVWSRTRQDDGR